MRACWIRAGVGLLGVGLLGVGLLFALPLWAADPVAGSPLQAVWKEQHLEFSYFGRTARYSCQGLRDKMRSLLLDLGARRDLQVSLYACDETESVRSLRREYIGPRLSLVFSTPALPDAAAKPLHPGDLMAVNARYEPFTLTSDAFRNYGVGDCELVEQFAHDILPHLSTRNVKQDITCIPYQASGSRYFIRGEILRAPRTP
jgi:hypothetical protein